MNLPKAYSSIMQNCKFISSFHPTINQVIDFMSFRLMTIKDMTTIDNKFNYFYNFCMKKDGLQELINSISHRLNVFGEAIIEDSFIVSRTFNHCDEPAIVHGKINFHESESVIVKFDISGSRKFFNLNKEPIQNVSSILNLSNHYNDRGISEIHHIFKMVYEEKALLNNYAINAQKNMYDLTEKEYVKNYLKAFNVKFEDDMIIPSKQTLHKMENKRRLIENWISDFYFRPLAEKNYLYYKNELVIPKIVWLTDVDEVKSFIELA